jgi:hypothetical protein
MHADQLPIDENLAAIIDSLKTEHHPFIQISRLQENFPKIPGGTFVGKIFREDFIPTGG